MIEQDPRLTEGPTFFSSLYGLLKRIINASNTNEKNIAANTTTLGNKVNRAGDTMTGGLNLVTPSTSATEANADNSTKIATTAWVNNAMATIATAAGFAINTGSNGYVKLPSFLGGFILQWGSTVLSGASLAQSYPLAFPNAVRAGVACAAGGAAASGMAGVRLDSNSSMTLFQSSGAALTLYWIIVGY